MVRRSFLKYTASIVIVEPDRFKTALSGLTREQTRQNPNFGYGWAKSRHLRYAQLLEVASAYADDLRIIFDIKLTTSARFLMAAKRLKFGLGLNVSPE